MLGTNRDRSRDQSAHSEQHLLTCFGQRFDRLSRGHIWALLIVAIAMVATADFGLHDARIILAPFYVLAICLASWKLGFRAGLGVAVASAAFPLSVVVAFSHDMTPVVIFTNFVLHTLVFGITAAIVAGYRYSHDREAQLAAHDRMTGMLNKHAFRDRADATIQLGRTQRRTLLFLFIDLDDFKSINDQFGHDAGDAILTRFADAAADLTRKSDCFGRIGGDEFAGMFMVDTVQDAQDLAQSIHKRFSKVLANEPFPTTCSIGALVIPHDCGLDLTTLWCGADRLMYAAKRAGKDCVQIATINDAAEELPSTTSPKIAGFNAASARIADVLIDDCCKDMTADMNSVFANVVRSESR